MLFEQSVDLSFVSCLCYVPGLIVSSESQHRTGQHFIECNSQSPNNYTLCVFITQGIKIVHPGSGILGKDVTFDFLVHMQHSCDHVALCVTFCSLKIFKWLALFQFVCALWVICYNLKSCIRSSWNPMWEVKLFK